MLCRTAALCLALCIALEGRAQQNAYINGGDTIRYTYTPVAQAPAPDTMSVVKKKNFLHRFVEYFDESTVDRTLEKKIDFTFAGGPSYSKNTNFGLGLLASGLFRIDRTDSVTQPSNISIFGGISITGFYALGVFGNTNWDRNKQRVDYTLAFSSAPTSLWGIGYDAGSHNPESTYVEKYFLLSGRYLHRVLPHTFVGALWNLQHTQGKKFTNEAYLEGQLHQYTSAGFGAVIEYDSRDFIPNPYKGLYVSLQEIFFPKPLSNCEQSRWRTTLTVDYYKQLWKGGILATDFYAEFNSSGTPWPMLARMGGSYRMRGYYQGRYTDNDLITLQVELRQRIWRRIGCVGWVGAGNVFRQLSQYNWSQTLPNYGVGLRWELKKRVNIRIDYGFGKNTSGFLLNINEAF